MHTRSQFRGAARFWAVLAGLVCLTGLALAGPVAQAHAASATAAPLSGHHHKHPGVVRITSAVSPETVQHAGVDAVTGTSAVAVGSHAVATGTLSVRPVDSREPLITRGRGPPSYSV